MSVFSKLDKVQKQAISLLSIGTFLEYFDLMLYIHMAVLLNDLFFPATDPETQKLLAAFAFSTTFVFRPIGALIFGYIGDTFGRKVTIVITTFMMAVTCLIMANVPTYAQIGMAAAWIVTICRALQGMSSLGEMVGAQLFLTEAIQLPARYPAVGLVSVLGSLGEVSALSIAALATSYNFNWRMAFWVGAGIALVGSAARTTLRESPEFADARRRLESVAERVHEDPRRLKKNAIYDQKVDKKTSLAYFLIKCTSPIFIYFVYIHSASMLKDSFGYSPHQVLVHNLFVGIFQLCGWAILRTYLSTRLYPLKILQFAWAVTIIAAPFLPLALNYISAPWHLFLIQSFMFLFIPNDFPASPIFFKNFPVFQRYKYVGTLYALAYASFYIVSSFGLTYLIRYFGNWGLLVIMLPVLIGYGYGINYFKKLDLESGRYKQEMNIRAEAAKGLA